MISELIRSRLADPKTGEPLFFDGEAFRSSTSTYPIVNSIPRFVENDFYAASFSFQWSKYQHTQVDIYRDDQASEQELISKTGFTREEMARKLVLDAGVGGGRFAEVVSRWGGEVVGTDLGNSVQIARDLLQDRDNVWIAQADIAAMPFLPETFDAIFSVGVLHHTPDTKAYFRKLVPLLKPGGTIAIWVYPNIGAYAVRKPWINFVNKIPIKAYHDWCEWFMATALKRKDSPLFNALWRSFPYPRDTNGFEWNVLDLFDSYSPAFHGIHSPEEVRRWFQEAGLVDVKEPSPKYPTCMRGRKPLR